MFKRKILFFIVFLTIPLTSCSLRKNDTQINQIEDQIKPEEKKISILRRKEKETLGEELNINETTFNQHKLIGTRIENDHQV